MPVQLISTSFQHNRWKFLTYEDILYVAVWITCGAATMPAGFFLLLQVQLWDSELFQGYLCCSRDTSSVQRFIWLSPFSWNISWKPSCAYPGFHHIRIIHLQDGLKFVLTELLCSLFSLFSFLHLTVLTYFPPLLLLLFLSPSYPSWWSSISLFSLLVIYFLGISFRRYIPTFAFWIHVIKSPDGCWGGGT